MLSVSSKEQTLDTPNEHKFEVVAKAYAKLKLMGIKPTRSLEEIGRELDLEPETVHRIHVRVCNYAKRHGLPRDFQDKRWVQATAKEEREYQAGQK